MDAESRAIRLPIPGMGKMLVFCLTTGLAWAIWSVDPAAQTNPQQQKREKLWSPDATATERIQAVEEWAAQGRYAIPELTRALASPHDNIRSTAVLALSRIGPLAHGCVPQLTTMLRDTNESVRGNVIHALMQIETNPEAMVPVLVDCLDDPKDNVRASATDALIRIGKPSVLPVCKFVKQTSGMGRFHGLMILIKLQMEHDELASVAHHCLADPDENVQSQALTILTFLDAYTVDEIVPFLESPSVDVKLQVLRALQRRPDEVAAVVSQIISLLDDDQFAQTDYDPQIVEQIFMTLKTIGTGAQEAIPLLAKFQKHPHSRYRTVAFEAAATITTDDDNLHRVMQAILEDQSAQVVSAAAETLQTAYPDRVPEIIAPLKARLISHTPESVMLAASAVYGIGPAAAELAPSLHACLKDPDLPRAIVILALGRIGEKAQSAIPTLIALMNIEELQTSIFWALGRIPAQPEHVAEIKGQILKSLSSYQRGIPMGYPMMRAGRGRDRDRVRKRIFALEAMGKLAGENESFAELLIENISEPDTPVRWTVIWALANLKGQEEQVVPLMIDSIGDTSRFVQATVLIGLGKVAHRPEISVPLLIDYLHDSDPYLQSAAALSLASFPVYGRSAVDSLQELIGVEPNSIKNGDRQSHSYWEIRRFPPHLEELQMISVRGAAEIALAAIENRTAQAGFQVEADDE